MSEFNQQPSDAQNRVLKTDEPSGGENVTRHRRSDRRQRETELPPTQRLDMSTAGDNRPTSLLEKRESTTPMPRQLTGAPRSNLSERPTARLTPAADSEDKGSFAPVNALSGSARARVRTIPAPASAGTETPRREPTERAPERPQMEYPAADSAQPVKKHTALTVVLVLVLLLAVAVVGLLLTPDDADNVFGTVKQAVAERVGGLVGGLTNRQTASPSPQPAVGSAMDLTVAPDTATAPQTVTFSLTTTGSVTNVRLVDAEGTPLSATTVVQQNNQNSTAWVLTRLFSDAYSGTVSVELEVGDTWKPTDQRATLSIAAAQVQPAATDEPQPTAEIAQALSITAAPMFETLPTQVIVTVTTTAAAEEVQLTDAGGSVLSASLMNRDSQNGNTQWVLNMTLNDAFDGQILARVRQGGEWLDSGVSVHLTVGTAETPDELPDEDYPEDDPSAEDVPWPYEPLEDDPDDPADEGTEAEDAGEGLTGLVDGIGDTTTPPPEATQVPLAWMDESTQPTPTLAPSPTPTIGQVNAELDPVMSDDELIEEEEVVDDQVPGTEDVVDSEPEATVRPPVTASASAKASPSLINSTAVYQNKKKLTTYSRDLANRMNMGDDSSYLRQPFGILTFRSSSFRKNASDGTVGDLSGMSVKWKAEAGSVRGKDQTYYGVVWNSQPLIVRWSKEVREFSNIVDEKRDTKNLREVIVAGNDGMIYFLDLADGEKTRNPINLGFPMHATPSISADGYPYMVVGQYARRMRGSTGKIGLRAYNLLNQSSLEMIDGLDTEYKRALYDYGSFQTSSLFDHTSGTMLAVGTNGLFYVSTIKNEVNLDTGSMTSKVENRTVLRTKAKGETDKQVAVESSPVAYGNYVWYADLGGVLRCVDVNTLEVIWAVDVGDSVRASLALDLDGSGNLWLYVADTLNASAKGDSHIACYNAMNGEERWSFGVGTTKYSSGSYKGIIPGVMASPVIGENALSDYVYYSVSLLTKAATQSLTDAAAAVPAVLLCVEKQTGAVKWAQSLDGYAYSSPVAVYNEDGHGWIVQASSTDTILLLEGTTGAKVADLKLEGTITASPAVCRGTLVIGTTGKNTSYIYGVTLE